MSAEPEQQSSNLLDQVEKKPSDADGFDAVVKSDRKKRKLTFGPNVVRFAKPNNILIDIYGVITSWEFVSSLKAYAKENLADYIQENWKTKLVKLTVTRVREQVKIDRMANIEVPEILEDTEDETLVQRSTIESLTWQYNNKLKTTKAQIDALCADLWSRAYDSGKLKTHTYPEVEDAFQYWRFEQFIKIYSYASGPLEGQRQFLKASVVGDLNKYIANGLNASGGYKFDPNKFRSVVAALREVRPSNLLYITDDPRKAGSAIQAGLRSLVVNRTSSNTGKYSPENVKELQVVTNLTDIQFVAEAGHTPECC